MVPSGAAPATPVSGSSPTSLEVTPTTADSGSDEQPVQGIAVTAEEEDLLGNGGFE